jgi:hypothetical protein
MVTGVPGHGVVALRQHRVHEGPDAPPGDVVQRELRVLSSGQGERQRGPHGDRVGGRDGEAQAWSPVTPRRSGRSSDDPRRCSRRALNGEDSVAAQSPDLLGVQAAYGVPEILILQQTQAGISGRSSRDSPLVS